MNGISDIISAFRLYRPIFFTAFLKLQLDNRKTFLAMLWEPLTALFVSSVLALVWSEILEVGHEENYFLYILFGFTLWNLLFAKLVNRAVPALSIRSIELTKSLKPISSLPLEDVAYTALSFATALPIILFASLYHYGMDLALFLVFIYGVVISLFTGFGLSLTLGVVAFFYRDVLHIIAAVMRLGFLITPVIWKPERLGVYAEYVWYNPFYSYLDICRSALMGEFPHLKSVYIASGITFTLMVLAFLVSHKFSKSVRSGVYRN